MPISFTCPHCGHQTQVADEYVGQRGPCAGCGREVTIAAGGGYAAPPRTGPSDGGKAAVGCAAGGVGLGVVVVGVVGLCGLGLLVGIALLLPAVQAAREAARRSACSNNIRQIALALHSYHDNYKMLPPAYTTDAEGRPLHSWRVLILPYMEQGALYARIDLSKPWDAPENAFLAEQMPSVYACPSDPDVRSNTTHYVVIVGEEAIFQPNGALSLSQLTNGDGAMNTIMVVESTDPVAWMSPEDLNLDEMSFVINDSAGSAIGSHHPGGANAAFGDASVRFLSEGQFPPEAVRGLTTARGGEVVNFGY